VQEEAIPYLLNVHLYIKEVILRLVISSSPNHYKKRID